MSPSDLSIQSCAPNAGTCLSVCFHAGKVKTTAVKEMKVGANTHPQIQTHLSSMFYTSLSPTCLRHLIVSRCNSWNEDRKKIPSSLLCKRSTKGWCTSPNSSVALFALWTRTPESETVGLATTRVYGTLLPMASFMFLHSWFSNHKCISHHMAISHHDEASSTYVWQVVALTTFCTSNSAISIGRILNCITVCNKVYFYLFKLKFV